MSKGKKHGKWFLGNELRKAKRFGAEKGFDVFRLKWKKDQTKQYYAGTDLPRWVQVEADKKKVAVENVAV